MKLLIKLLVLFLVAEAPPANSAQNSPLTIGYFPSSFPRDPARINVFMEHFAVGQVIEPLIQVNQEGSISPAIAKSWRYGNNRTQLILSLRDDIRFSNGIPLAAADVVSTIAHHLHDRDAGSNSYFEPIRDIKIDGPHQISIHLKRPYPALLRVLARENLGIQPSNWRFNASSEEPYMGTGPYRIVRTEGQWYFRKNINYRGPSPAVSDWKIIVSDTPLTEVDAGNIPDLIPVSPEDLTRKIKSISGASSRYKFLDRISFRQTGSWTYPNSPSANNLSRRIRIQTAFRQLFDRRRKELGYPISTGVIPNGVTGHLPSPVSLPAPPKVDLTQPIDVNVITFKAVHDEVFGGTRPLPEETANNIRFKVTAISATDLPKVKSLTPEVFVLSYYGGFNDPEGFLFIFEAAFATRPSEYLDSTANQVFNKARVEPDERERSKLFQKLGLLLQTSHLMVPAWSHPLSTILKPSLVMEPGLRETPLLSTVYYDK